MQNLITTTTKNPNPQGERCVPLLDELTFYARELPYFQRILATGLAGSLQHSISEVGADRLRQSLPLLSLALQ